MKDLVFLQSCPDDNYFIWQTHLWLESLQNIGQSHKAISCIFVPNDRKERNPKWDELIKLYPKSEFFFTRDDKNEIGNVLGIYIPILRPFVISKYFELHPEMKEKAIFYCDADIIFTDKFDVTKYIDDDICYLSDTKSYINASYFDSKIKDVKPEKLEQYKKGDVLGQITKAVGISREIAEKNNEHSGGAQYLLKNIDADFWKKVKRDCLLIRQYLLNTNRTFFESENKGFQSWAADMWAVLWNLWLREQETRIVPEMDFAWSTDNISKLEKVGILHNAGVSGDFHGDVPMFYKGKYHNNTDPFDDGHLEKVLNDEKNKTFCNNIYLQKMFEIKTKYNIKYK